MSVVIQSLFPISHGDAYINSLPIIIMFHGGNAAWYTTFSELHHSLKEHSFFLLQLQGTFLSLIIPI